MSHTFDLYTQVRLSVEFRNLSGVLTDPATLTLDVLSPGGTQTTGTYSGTASGVITIIRDGAGRYHADITLDERGKWGYRWRGTVGLIVAEEESLIVEEGLIS